MSHAVRARTTLAYSPEWNGPVSYWAQKYIRENKWRVDTIFDDKDLLQEAYLIFHKLSSYYPRIIEPARFMAIFKISLVNWFNDRSLYMKRKNTVHANLKSDVSELGELFGEQRHDAYLNMLLQEAPEELKLALALLITDPAKLEPTKMPRGHRENLNMRLRRILGLKPGFDLKAALTELLFN